MNRTERRNRRRARLRSSTTRYLFEHCECLRGFASSPTRFRE
jgi:hypothetical protein